MVSVYATTFARVSEIARGMLVRRLADVRVIDKMVERTSSRSRRTSGPRSPSRARERRASLISR